MKKEEIIKQLEKIQSKLPPRDGQKKNVFVLLANWKKHINAIDRLIKKLKRGKR